MTRHRILFVIVLLVSVLSGCDSREQNIACGRAVETVAAQGGQPDALSVGVANNVAMAAPLTDLDSLGVADTELRTASTPEELRANFISGRYDIAALPVNVAANLCARGVDTVLLGAVSGNVIYLMGPPGTGLTDLKGQTLHIPFPNDIVDLLTRQLLDGAQIGYRGDQPDVELEYHPTPLDIATGMASGDIRYAVLPEHLATVVADSADGVTKAVSLQQLWTEQTGAARLPFAGYVVHREFARRYPQFVARLQDAFTAAAKRVTDDPAAGARAIAEVIPVPADITEGLLPGMAPAFTAAGAARADLEKLYAALLSSEPDSVGGALPGPGFYAGAPR